MHKDLKSEMRDISLQQGLKVMIPHGIPHLVESRDEVAKFCWKPSCCPVQP